jgi:hypothetical protein
MIAVRPFNKATNANRNIGDTEYASPRSPGRRMDCFVALLLAMTAKSRGPLSPPPRGVIGFIR